jgi:hypothetical protein
MGNLHGVSCRPKANEKRSRFLSNQQLAIGNQEEIAAPNLIWRCSNCALGTADCLFLIAPDCRLLIADC